MNTPVSRVGIFFARHDSLAQRSAGGAPLAFGSALELRQLGDAGGREEASRRAALDTLVAGLAQHAEQHHYELWCDGQQRAAALRRRLGSEGEDGRVVVRDWRSLSGQPSRLALSACHDPGGDPFRPFALRAAASAPFPVTLPAHSISRREQLHDFFLRLLLSRPAPCDSLICPSDSAGQALLNLLEHVSNRFNESYGSRLAYQGRLDVVPPAVDTELYQPRPKAALRRRLMLPPDSFVLLWVGRLSAVDVVELLPLLQLLQRLTADNQQRQLRLMLAGKDRAGERFSALLADRVEQLGIAHQVLLKTAVADLRPLYSAADVLVLPVDSLQDDTSETLLEAMACGLPPVVSDWNGYRELIQHEETGLLCPTLWSPCDSDLCELALLGSPEHDQAALAQTVAVDMVAFQQAVQALLDNEELRLRLGQDARRQAVDEHSVETVVRRHEQLWAELLEHCKILRLQPTLAARYALPSYVATFNHYPTELLHHGVVVELTESGRRLIAGEVELPLSYGGQQHQLSPGIISQVMRGLTEAERLQRRFTIKLIAGTIARKLDQAYAFDVVVRHILWLLKHGFISRPAS